MDTILKCLQSDDCQISSFILDNFGPILNPIGYPTIWGPRLKALSKFLKFMDALGDEEHTGDWDPYLKITLLDGSIIETESGYWSLEVFEDGGMTKVSIENEEDPLTLDIMTIKSIEIINQ